MLRMTTVSSHQHIAESERPVCNKCGRPLDSLACGHCRKRLPPEQTAELSALWKMATRMGDDRRKQPYGGDGICFSADEEDTHTNGPTRGIEPAPQWVVDGAAKLIGGPFDLDVAASQRTQKPRDSLPHKKMG